MRCPTLIDLPPPPPEKKGWPWDEESSPIYKNLCGLDNFPLISIVTPSLDQEPYIEETIRSVLLQGYPNIQYIIIDGGSKDKSLEIIRKYEHWIDYWVSEPDKGQGHAINKGFTKASGQLFAYINSDDLYEPNAFYSVAIHLLRNNDLQLIAGECVVFNEKSIKRIIKPWWPMSLSYFIKKTYSSTFAQPSSFWTRHIYLKAGEIDQSLHFCFDREFFLRLGLLGVRPIFIGSILSRFREHANSKTVSNAANFHRESISILEKYSQTCGIPNWKTEKWKKRMKNEIEYSEVFSLWKKEGRIKAIKIFLKMILKTPSLMLERKILGQARRLFTFSEKDVNELIGYKGHLH